MIFAVFIVSCFVISAKNHETMAVETPKIALSDDFSYKETGIIWDLMDKGKTSSAEKIISSGNYSFTSIKLFYWWKYVNISKDVDFHRISNFIRSNPDWPKQGNMIVNAESAINPNVSDRDLLAWFSRYKPRTYNAKIIYINLLKESSSKQEYIGKIKEYWRENIFVGKNQKDYYKKFSKYLNKEDHKSRLDLLLRNNKGNDAKNVAKLLGRDYVHLANARTALSKKKNGVDKLIKKVPPYLKNNEGLLYERLKWRRKKDYNDGAIKILLNPPKIESKSQKKKWWRERHIMIRRMLEEKKYETAYKLAISNVQDEGFPQAQALWVSGWLALQFMDRKHEAQQYFEIMYGKVKTPVSKSRAAYWNARAYSDMGDSVAADKWYREAANYGTSFYGQLAAEKLGIKPLVRQIRKSRKGENTLANEELLKVAGILAVSGQNRKASMFIHAASKKESNAGEQHVIAKYAKSLGLQSDSVFVMKRARNSNRGIDASIAYPVNSEWMKNVDIEWSFIHGLIRQESAFDKEALSPAGARGLMQIMPATAKMVARNEKLKHQTSWLTTKHKHNIALGTSYLGSLLDRYDNSYILATAAYNAGPSRVDRWIKTYGDPRKGNVDEIDWIEMIPIYETRNYVQRILENIYVYRQRLRNIDTKTTILSSDNIFKHVSRS